MSILKGLDRFSQKRRNNNKSDDPTNSQPAMVKSSNTKQILKSGPFIIECHSSKNQLTGECIIKQADNDKIVFVGKLMYGMRTGYGREFNENQEQIYQGEYLNNMRNGWGKTKQYSGEFRDNQYSGYGRLLTQQQFYEGSFLKGDFDGMGIYLKGGPGGIKNQKEIWQQYRLIQKNCSKLFGNLTKGHNIQEVFIGQWSHGYKNGSGKLWKQFGNYWYSGQFSHNVYHGNGTLHKNGNDIKKGVFEKGKIRE